MAELLFFVWLDVFAIINSNRLNSCRHCFVDGWFVIFSGTPDTRTPRNIQNTSMLVWLLHHNPTGGIAPNFMTYWPDEAHFKASRVKQFGSRLMMITLPEVEVLKLKILMFRTLRFGLRQLCNQPFGQSFSQPIQGPEHQNFNFKSNKPQFQVM